MQQLWPCPRACAGVDQGVGLCEGYLDGLDPAQGSSTLGTCRGRSYNKSKWSAVCATGALFSYQQWWAGCPQDSSTLGTCRGRSYKNSKWSAVCATGALLSYEQWWAGCPQDSSTLGTCRFATCSAWLCHHCAVNKRSELCTMVGRALTNSGGSCMLSCTRLYATEACCARAGACRNHQ
jgi:hypothetical protein